MASRIRYRSSPRGVGSPARLDCRLLPRRRFRLTPGSVCVVMKDGQAKGPLVTRAALQIQRMGNAMRVHPLIPQLG